MLNKYPLWKYLLILAIIAIGAIYAIPNIYPQDPAIQISSNTAGGTIPEEVIEQALDALAQQDITPIGQEIKDKTTLIRFANTDIQYKAQEIIEKTLGDEYVVALNLAPTTPEWLANMGANPMKLGLDLRGGVHFLMEVDMNTVLTRNAKSFRSEVRDSLSKANIGTGTIRRDQENHSLTIRCNTEIICEAADDHIRKEFDQFTRAITESEGDFLLTLRFTEEFQKSIEERAIEQNILALRNRVNEIGVSEPLVQRQGKNRIVVELPGVQDAAQAKRQIEKVANLEVRLEALPDAPSYMKERFPFRDKNEGFADLESTVILTGENVTNAFPSFDQNNKPIVVIHLDSQSGLKLHKVTADKVDRRRLGILLIEQKVRSVKIINDAGEEVLDTETQETKEIISLANIGAALGSQFQIEGIGNQAETRELSLLLRAGAYAAPMFFVEERTIGPNLGQDNIDAGMYAIQIGFLAVLIFMLFYYKIFGLFANIALTVNLVLIVAVMSFIEAVLTLPGIAGIVLTVGMAVDANVLIFSRIREEMNNGLPPQSAIQAGYDRAFVTILDANLTTLLVAIILFGIGTGPIKGFAITLSIGIITSMFTAIMGTRALANLFYGGRSVKKLAI